MSAPLMHLGQVHAWLQARHAGYNLPLHGAPDTAITRVHTDSRSVQPGDLFVALQGESFDANAFLAQAQAAGAVAVLCRTGLDTSQLPAGLPCIEVPDTTLALGHLAQAWRQQFDVP
ncbi:MAG: UDP-N-acetylmuramoylalanyl-D-glutamyl-2, 6-diaminopimelate--D-alanyl-D-alanine ligase, partial [Betaproteobacteria bacterium]|nr:UDP-N-acetylmuramoylalanyl-D-glutamyl-2, 6-diaminopimelate--D-alanyl-D-alanine ligase [Betaproteobacteria bacterium]